MAARLKQHYETVVRPALMDEFKYESVMRVPRLEKITLNTESQSMGRTIYSRPTFRNLKADAGIW